MHKRTKIGQNMTDILKASETLARSNVRYGFAFKPDMETLPVVLIYPQTEQIDELNQAPRELRRNLFMSVECISQGDDMKDCVEKLDNLADQVEQALSKDDTLNGTADDIILNGVEFQYEGDETESPVGSCRMSYLVKYRELFPRDQVGITDLEKINSKWDISPEGDPDEIIEAEDCIKFEQQ